MMHKTRKVWAIASGAVLLTGCQFGGLNSLNMPGTAGHGDGSYKITVELPDVSTLPQNSPVMIDDVTVGSVSGLDAVQRRLRNPQLGLGDLTATLAVRHPQPS